MVDFKLTEQQIMIRDVVRRFVQEEVIPVRAELDREPDPKKGFSWDLLRKADAIGLRTLALPEEHGGIGATDHQVAGLLDHGHGVVGDAERSVDQLGRAG